MPRKSVSHMFFKNEVRKALRVARTAREQGNAKAADTALNRAAKARKALLTQCVTIPLARELWDTADRARRRALAAHLLNSLKAHPRFLSREAAMALIGFPVANDRVPRYSSQCVGTDAV